MSDVSTSPPARLAEAFAIRFRELSGEAHLVDSIDSAASKVAEITGSESAACVALAHLESDLAGKIRTALNPTVRVLAPPYPAAELPELLDAAQVSVTGVDWGIAETATLVEVCTDDSVRLVSGLPRTHIGIVRASTLVEKFVDAAEPMRKALAANPENCSISFISGPSRTGDIEMILTLGVHGPERAHAIVIEDC